LGPYKELTLTHKRYPGKKDWVREDLKMVRDGKNRVGHNIFSTVYAPTFSPIAYYITTTTVNK